MPLPTKKSGKTKGYINKIYLIYGKPKSGKTTLVSNLGGDEGDVLFIPTEPGHKYQDIFKYQVDYKSKVADKDGNIIQVDAQRDIETWLEFRTAMREYFENAHSYKMIAIDVVDRLWAFCSRYVCEKHGIENEADMGYGKGFKLVKDEFMSVIDFIAARGVGIVFISHESTSEVKIGPKTLTYHDTTLPNTAKKAIHGICDFIFYMHLDPDGRRILRTKPTENINAGDRSGKLVDQYGMDNENMFNFINELKNKC